MNKFDLMLDGYIPNLEKKLERLSHNPNDYFNEQDTFLFFDGGRLFVSKVHKYNSVYYTNESLQYRASTLKSLKLGSGIVTTIGVYGDGSYNVNGVDLGDFQTHICYNLINRWGRSFIANGVVLYRGGNSMEKLEEFLTQKLPIMTRCTAPYN